MKKTQRNSEKRKQISFQTINQDIPINAFTWNFLSAYLEHICRKENKKSNFPEKVRERSAVESNLRVWWELREGPEITNTDREAYNGSRDLTVHARTQLLYICVWVCGYFSLSLTSFTSPAVGFSVLFHSCWKIIEYRRGGDRGQGVGWCWVRHGCRNTSLEMHGRRR